MNKRINVKLLLVAVSLVWLILPFLLLPIFGSNFNMIIRPVFWILIAIITHFILPKYELKFSNKRYDVRQLALIGALVYIIIYFSSGLIIGYTKSPFNRSLLGILRNSWMIISIIVAQELVRDRFFKASFKHDKWFTIIFMTIAFILFDLNLHSLGNVFSSVGSFMGFLTKNLIASIVIQSFTSYLTYRDGYKSALWFRIPYEFVFLIAPVFPGNVFVVLLVIETVIPLMIYLKIEKTYQRNNVFGLPKKQSTFDKMSRLAFTSFLIFLVTFSMGLFAHYPIVIASNSMFPYIKRGDIVIVRKTTFEEIKINDIIEYSLDNISIIHRVLEIRNTRDGKVLITKGDNNQSIDAKDVTEGQVNGIIVGNIPKAGYPTLWLREIISGQIQVDVETGG
jgi:signal peptidase I